MLRRKNTVTKTLDMYPMMDFVYLLQNKTGLAECLLLYDADRKRIINRLQ
jgi:hypothetical protein